MSLDTFLIPLILFVSIGKNVFQDLTHLRSISIGQNLHKLVNQRSFGFLADANESATKDIQ